RAGRGVRRRAGPSLSGDPRRSGERAAETRAARSPTGQCRRAREVAVSGELVFLRFLPIGIQLGQGNLRDRPSRESGPARDAGETGTEPPVCPPEGDLRIHGTPPREIDG